MLVLEDQVKLKKKIREIHCSGWSHFVLYQAVNEFSAMKMTCFGLVCILFQVFPESQENTQQTAVFSSSFFSHIFEAEVAA